MSDDDERRRAISERIDALGLGDREWERKTGIPRQTVNRVIEGDTKTRTSTFLAIESALGKLEDEAAGKPVAEQPTPAEPQLVTFRVTGDFGVEVVVSGPVDNIDDLRQTVEKLMRGMGHK